MAKKFSSKEIEFVQRAQHIVFESNRDSLASVKAGDTLVVDEQYSIKHGGWLSIRSGDEFRVKFVDTHNSLMKPIYIVVVTKAPKDGSYFPRHKVGDEIELNEYMPLYDHIHRKNDSILAARLRKLCRDYLDGLL